MARLDTKAAGSFGMAAKPHPEGFKMFLGNFVLGHGDMIDEIRPACQDDLRHCHGLAFGHDGCMGRSYTPEEFERLFVLKIVGIIEGSSGLNHSRFAKYVWGDNEASVKKWQRIRRQSKGGKPQHLTIAEAFRMVQFLRTDFPSFSWDVAKEAEDLEKKQPDSNRQLPQQASLPTKASGE
jgi:hypothetical protein